MLAKLILVTAATTGGGVLFWNGVPYSIENAKCCSFLPIKSRLFCHEFKHSLVYFLQGWIKLWCTKIVIIHCREEGCIGKYAPWGKLEGRGVQILEYCQIVNHYSSMPWFKYRNLSVIVNCVSKSLNRSKSKSKSLSL